MLGQATSFSAPGVGLRWVIACAHLKARAALSFAEWIYIHIHTYKYHLARACLMCSAAAGDGHQSGAAAVCHFSKGSGGA